MPWERTCTSENIWPAKTCNSDIAARLPMQQLSMACRPREHEQLLQHQSHTITAANSASIGSVRGMLRHRIKSESMCKAHRNWLILQFVPLLVKLYQAHSIVIQVLVACQKSLNVYARVHLKVISSLHKFFQGGDRFRNLCGVPAYTMVFCARFFVARLPLRFFFDVNPAIITFCCMNLASTKACLSRTSDLSSSWKSMLIDPTNMPPANATVGQ